MELLEAEGREGGGERQGMKVVEGNVEKEVGEGGEEEWGSDERDGEVVERGAVPCEVVVGEGGKRTEDVKDGGDEMVGVVIEVGWEGMDEKDGGEVEDLDAGSNKRVAGKGSVGDEEEEEEERVHGRQTDEVARETGIAVDEGDVAVTGIQGDVAEGRVDGKERLDGRCRQKAGNVPPHIPWKEHAARPLPDASGWVDQCVQTLFPRHPHPPGQLAPSTLPHSSRTRLVPRPPPGHSPTPASPQTPAPLPL